MSFSLIQVLEMLKAIEAYSGYASLDLLKEKVFSFSIGRFLLLLLTSLPARDWLFEANLRFLCFMS